MSYIEAKSMGLQKYYENGKLSRRSGYKEGVIREPQRHPGGQKAVKGQYLKGLKSASLPGGMIMVFVRSGEVTRMGKSMVPGFITLKSVGSIKACFYEGVDLEVEDGY